MKTSIAICTYNGEKYIEEELDSIAAQTVKPDEIVICDDGSKDNTVSIIRKYISSHDLNITLYQNEINLGYAKNFEKCISLCSGDIVFMCDQDDIWMPTKVEKFIEAFEANPNAVYVFSDAYVTDENGKITYNSLLKPQKIKWFELKENDFFEYFSKKCFLNGFLIAVKRDYANEIMPFKFAHDEWLAMFAPLYGEIVAINECLAKYRRHAAATSNSMKQFSKRSVIRAFFSKLKLSYEEYFDWYSYQLRAYSEFLSFCKEKNLSTEKLSLIVDHMNFLKCLDKVKYKNFIQRWGMLLKEYNKGEYKKYRGNKNMLIFDMIFMFFNSFRKKKNR